MNPNNGLRMEIRVGERDENDNKRMAMGVKRKAKSLKILNRWITYGINENKKGSG